MRSRAFFYVIYDQMGMIYWLSQQFVLCFHQRAPHLRPQNECKSRSCVSARRPLFLIYLILIIFSTHLSGALSDWLTGWLADAVSTTASRSLAQRTMSETRALKMRSDKSTSYYFKCYVALWECMNGQRFKKNEWTVSVVWHPWLVHYYICISKYLYSI